MDPVTRVGVIVTFLRMDHAPRTPPPELPPGMRILRAEAPTVPFYRYLYNTVGADYLWWLRRTTPDNELAALLNDRAIGIYTLYAKGEPAGFFELDRRVWPDVNLSYFGLMPFAIGTGVGHAFLRCAVDEAWRLGAQGMTVNTCTADHPRALPNYLRAGFRIVRKVREVWAIPNSLNMRIPETLRL
jgi:GNAT superfamily N-acetyltransferase